MPVWMQPEPVTLPDDLVEAVGSRPLAELLFRRGITTPAAALDFLTGGIDVDAPGLPDLEEGVSYVLEAVLRGQRICVYGDYDTDGVTSTTLLVGLLRSLGADVSYYIPNRFRDGYGMNARAVEALAGEGTALILTCDCGIRNHAEVALARQLGMTVVVTDHHELGPTLPEAEAVINPKRLPPNHPCHMLPGVGTAYLLARQVYRALDRDPAEADRWLDLLAVGIIADVVPLHGANRELARHGLTRLNTSPCPGLEALMSVAGMLGGYVNEEDVAFQLVPRINSAGRLADATLGARLLLSAASDEAQDLATQLDQLNQDRKKWTASVVEAAVAEAKPGAGAILLYRPEWHEGVLGIAAGKLAEQFGVPALLMARKHNSNVLVGSARAPGGFQLHEALEACGEYLLKHGGHAAAAGFSLLEEQFEPFRAAMLEEARRRAGQPGTEPPGRTADLALPLAEVDRDLYDDLRRAAPFGEANPAPIIFSKGVRVLSSRPIGPGERHLRMVLRDGEQSLVGVWWGAGATVLEPGEVDLFYHLGLNRWNNEELLQVVVDQLGERTPTAERSAPDRPALLDRRGYASQDLLREFHDALFYAEGDAYGELHPVDRYSVRRADDLVLLTPPPSPRLLDEAVAQSGARRVILAWPTFSAPEEDRFLHGLMRIIAGATQRGPYVDIARLAVLTGELESAVRLALDALAASDLLAVDEDHGDVVCLRLRTDGRGIKDSEALTGMRRLLGESRAFRRFLRKGSPEAIARAIYPART